VVWRPRTKNKSDDFSAARRFENRERLQYARRCERCGLVDGRMEEAVVATRAKAPNGYRRRSVHHIHSSFGSARQRQSINTKFPCRRKIAACRR